MEAIGREHCVTKSYLRQACLDIERNGLESTIYLPTLKKYRDGFHGHCSNIPMIARNAVGRHTDVVPILPGRLPLGKPQGRLPPSNMRMGKPNMLPPTYENIVNLEGLEPRLGPATRNITVTDLKNDTSQGQKRKRISPSPGFSGRVDLGMMGLTARDSAGIDMSVDDQGVRFASEMPSGSRGKPQHRQHNNAALADRTSSSGSSSPRNGEIGYAETQSGSSHTSPGVFGLGSTPEENRVDLRSFQGRIATPIWQGSSEDVFFGQIPDSMMNTALATDGTDPWGILNGEVDWGNNPLAK